MISTHKVSLRLGCYLAAMFLLSPTVYASTAPLNFKQIVNRSEVIVTGTIEEITSRKTKNGVYTYAVIPNASFISDGVISSSGESFTLRYSGGIVEDGLDDKGNKTYGVYHDSENTYFELKDKIVVFVKDNGISDDPLVGASQGAFFLDENDSLISVNGWSIAVSPSGRVVEMYNATESQKMGYELVGADNASLAKTDTEFQSSLRPFLLNDLVSLISAYQVKGEVK